MNQFDKEIGYFIFFHNLTKEYKSYQYTIQVMIFLLVGSFAVVFIVVNLGFNILISRLDQSSKENATLVRELCHRVKNNFQILIAYISSEQIKEKHNPIKNKLNTIVQKLKSMAIIHEMLYGEQRVSKLNIKNYFFMFFSHLDLSNINYSLDIANIELESKIVKKLGLLVNELVINSMKHLHNDKATIYFSLKLVEKNIIKIEYQDDTVEKSESKIETKGYGTIFIDDLTSSLKNCTVKKGINNFHYIITFEV